MKESLDFLKEQLELMRDALRGQGSLVTDLQKAKFAGYEQAIIDLEDSRFKDCQLYQLRKLADEAERVLLALQQDGLPKGKYPHLARAVEAARSTIT